MNFKLLDIVHVITGFQFLLLSFFLIFNKKGNRLSNVIFSLFLFSKGLSIFTHLLFRLNIYVDFPYLLYLQFDYSFLYGPLIFFYTKSIVYRNFSIKKSYFIHFTPFILASIFQVALINRLITDINQEFIIPDSSHVFWRIAIVRSIIHFLQVAAYLFASLRILSHYRKEIKNVFSSLYNVNLSWLNFVIFGFIGIWAIDTVILIILLIIKVPSVLLELISIILIFIYANIIVLRGLMKSEIFSGIEEKPKYEYSTLIRSDIEDYIKKLRTYMETKKPHLESSLTINQLAKKLSMPTKHLSQVINDHLNQNFIEFVNRYRIEEAKQILLDSRQYERTVLQVLLDVGFNSKSVFNRAFKKYTGMTPSKFKRVHKT